MFHKTITTALEVVFAPIIFGVSVIVWATKGSDYVIKTCIGDGHGLSAKQSKIFFNYCCKVGRINEVKILMTAGANYWNEGLKYACIGGHLDVVKLMVENGADIHNDEPLKLAIQHKHADIVEFIETFYIQ